ncbi:MAG: GNAT family N-acetyltransferase [Candidatus Riflebacteria bacterium]|nr:GNAT family N-acetyltransferase [Candidatus Riflebacteria bacterium]
MTDQTREGQRTSSSCETLAVDDEVDCRDWDELVDSCPRGTLFSRSSWLDAVRDAAGCTIRVLCVRKGPLLVAGAAFVEKARGPIRVAGSLPFTAYGGVMSRPFDGQEAPGTAETADDVLATLTKGLLRRYLRVELVHSPPWADSRPFLRTGWTVVPRYTYRVRLADRDAIWQGFESRTRTSIRAVQSLGFELRIGRELASFWPLFEQVYQRQGLHVPCSETFVRTVFDRLQERGSAVVASLETSSGRAAAAVILLTHRRELSAWLIGAEHKKDASGLQALLLWRVMERFADRYDSLDFLGCNLPRQALFKRGFGGSLVPYPLTRIRRPGLAGGLMDAVSRLRGQGAGFRTASRHPSLRAPGPPGTPEHLPARE